MKQYFAIFSDLPTKSFTTEYHKMIEKSVNGIADLSGLTIGCPREDQLLKSFEMEIKRKTKKFRFNFQCLDMKARLNNISFANEWTACGNWTSNPGGKLGNVNFLDRQVVDCKGFGYLTFFTVEMDFEAQQLRFVYR
jgi:hypothetical protein